MRTLYKVSRKTWKNTVFSHFLMNVAQKAQKTLFFRIFCELCTKCLEKREKTLFSHTFWWTSRKKLKKQLFYPHFLRTLYKVSRKTWKKHCFLTLFDERRAKSSKNAVFRIFRELCTKCLEKREKTLFSHTFW